MKTITKISALLLIVILGACENKKINPSSNVTIQDRTIEDYTEIDISTAFTVDITYSATEEKIEIETNENLHAYIDVLKSGNALVIKVKDNTNIQGTSTLKAHITTSNPIDRISVRDASLLTMNNTFSGDALEFAVLDASRMVGAIEAASVTANFEDASNVSLSGSIENMTLNGYDASALSGFELSVKNVICTIKGATEVSLTVTETIDLTASDASVFMYKGDAVITDINLDDASQIIKVE